MVGSWKGESWGRAEFECMEQEHYHWRGFWVRIGALIRSFEMEDASEAGRIIHIKLLTCWFRWIGSGIGFEHD
jgi:hypothetical protein